MMVIMMTMLQDRCRARPGLARWIMCRLMMITMMMAAMMAMTGNDDDDDDDDGDDAVLQNKCCVRPGLAHAVDNM